MRRIRTHRLLLLLGAVGCATAPDLESYSRNGSVEESRRHIQDLREQISILTGKIETIELKLATAKEAKRIEAPSIIETRLNSQAKEIKSEKPDAIVKPIPSEEAFIEDEPVKNYKAALELFKQKKFPEAMLAFTSFSERYADHPFAGAAQFYSGQSYFFQSEYRLALQEYERVLTSYDRSSFVSETLKQIALCEDALKQKEDAHKHRQLLKTLFSKSPAAKSIAELESSKTRSTPPTAPAEGP